MPRQIFDLIRSRTSLDMDITLILFVKISQFSWLFHGALPGLERLPITKLPINEVTLMSQLNR